MRPSVRFLVSCLPLIVAALFGVSLYVGQLPILSYLAVFATPFALLVGSLSLSLAVNARLAIKPQFVQVSLHAAGTKLDKKYRVVAEIMNIGGRSANKCSCEVMEIIDGTPRSLTGKVQLDFVPIDTPVGKLEPLTESSTFSLLPSTRIRLRNYIPERLRKKGEQNLILKLDAAGSVVWSYKFGLPDWSKIATAQKHSPVLSFFL